MVVFGERQHLLDTREALDAIAQRAPAIVAGPPGLARHAALAEAFLDLGMLVQGLADAQFETSGEDDDTPLQAAAMRAVASLARPLAQSWRGGFRGPLRLDPEPLRMLGQTPAPGQVRCKVPEGYAFYAVYPEAYVEAAAGVGGEAVVIGLRSIGVTLAAAAAAALDAPPPVTLRPVGHPFDRQIRATRRLEARVALERRGPVVIADEGPGLSGSSFSAAADWLQGQGVAPEDLVFMPSHGGEPGAVAGEDRRRRWTRARRLVREFDDIAVAASWPAHRLQAWVEDLTGPAIEPLRDISGGAWRSLRQEHPRAWPPVFAGQERRKFLLTSASGVWLLKFAGLGRTGREKAERARRLGAAGLTPPVAGFRHGFLVERWRGDAARGAHLARPHLIGALARYLAFRAEAFPAGPEDGATLSELQAMIEANAAEALGADAARALARRFPAGGLPLRPVRIDGRLHPWEWLTTADGRLLKTDAVDHDDAHDLVGCQDLAWDVAGAEAEFDLSAGELDGLMGALARARFPVGRDALDVMRLAYPAFQLGLWTNAAAAASPDERVRIAPLVEGYARRLQGLASS